MSKLTIQEMQNLAKSRGGRCLSKKYVDNKTKLKWQCSKGHLWEARPHDIKDGNTWCPICSIGKRSEKRRLTIEGMQKIAKSRGGKCLSKDYINARTKLKWQCERGHIWESEPVNIKNKGQWCTYCRGR
jgi:hypothetical protein